MRAAPRSRPGKSCLSRGFHHLKAMPSPGSSNPTDPRQDDLFGAPDSLPEGFRYRPELITPAQEAELVRELESLPFQPFSPIGAWQASACATTMSGAR